MTTTKEQLKQVAREKLQRQGVRALTMRDLGEEVGIKSSSVMYHFKSKDGLLLELATDYTNNFIQFLSQVDQTVPNPTRRMGALLDMIESVSADGKFCLCGMLASDVHELDDATTQVIKGYFSRFETWVAALLQDGGAAAYDKKGAESLAQVVVSGIEGAMLMDRSEGTLSRVTAIRAWAMSLMR